MTFWLIVLLVYLVFGIINILWLAHSLNGWDFDLRSKTWLPNYIIYPLTLFGWPFLYLFYIFNK